MADTQTVAAPSYDEKTLPQLLVAPAGDTLTKDSKTSGTFYKTIRELRKQPTVKMARILAAAPVLASEWSVEAKDDAPEGAKEEIEKQFLPLRNHVLSHGYLGCSDYGWQSFEKVFKIDEISGLIAISKLKPLLPDKTLILVDAQTGAFAGLRQEADNVTLAIEESLLLNFNVEGTDWYGHGDMESVRIAVDMWNGCNDAAMRYDKKLAGAHWVVYYPTGKSKINGKPKDNYEIAREVLAGLTASGGMIVPSTVEAFVDELENQSGNSTWKIELLSAYPTSNVAFIDRLKYLDALISRALNLPERATLEGQFGTKAESEAHADFAITNMDLRHGAIVNQINWHCVNHVLRLNYGPEFENTVFIRPTPITDLKLQYLRAVYTKFLENADGFMREAESVDANSLRELLGVPSLSEDERVKLEATRAAEEPAAAAAVAASFLRGLTA